MGGGSTKWENEMREVSEEATESKSAFNPRDGSRGRAVKKNKKTASLQVGANTHDAHHVFVGAPLHPLSAIMEHTLLLKDMHPYWGLSNLQPNYSIKRKTSVYLFI